MYNSSLSAFTCISVGALPSGLPGFCLSVEGARVPRNFHLHQGLLGEYTQLSSNQWGQLRGVTYKSAELRCGTEPRYCP